MRKTTFALIVSAGAVGLGQIFNVFGQGDEGAQVKMAALNTAWDSQRTLETLSFVAALSRQSIQNNSLTVRECKYAHSHQNEPDGLLTEYRQAVNVLGLSSAQTGLPSPDDLQHTRDAVKDDIQHVLENCQRIYPSGF